MDPIKDLKFEQYYEQDFELLINAAIEIGNSVDGQKTKGDQRLYYAEGIGQKVMSHAISAHYLAKGYQLQGYNYSYQPQVDFGSIIILTRAALESYLTLNYVFVSGADDEEKKFRFDCWNLGGFVDRQGFVPKSDDQRKLKDFESGQIIDIRRALEQSEIYGRLKAADKRNALQGKWKLSKSWTDIAVQAGFNEQFFRNQYGFLCSHAHSSRLSIIQVQQTKDLVSQINMAKASIAILMVVLAKFMYDYIHLIPELKHLGESDPRYVMIKTWKLIGESLPH